MTRVLEKGKAFGLFTQDDAAANEAVSGEAATHEESSAQLAMS